MPAYWRAEWLGARAGRQASQCVAATDEGDRFDDFAIRRWGRRGAANWPGAQVEVVGLSKEKVEELFWDTITQVRADLAGVAKKWFRFPCGRWNETGISARHCRSWCVMMTVWIDAPWNGSATTS